MKSKKKYMIYKNTVSLDIVEKTKLLSSFPIFEGVTTAKVQEFAGRVVPKVFRPMEIFFEEEVDESHAHFVYNGAVSVFRTSKDGEIINIDLLGAPALVGETGLIEKKKSVASVMAISETFALTLSQEDFNSLIQKHPEIAIKLIKLFSDRVRNFNLFLEHLLSNDLYERTWYMLQYLAGFFPNNEITLSQEELSDLIWGTRSRVSEVLSKMEKEGKISTNHRKIKLL